MVHRHGSLRLLRRHVPLLRSPPRHRPHHPRRRLHLRLPSSPRSPPRRPHAPPTQNRRRKILRRSEKRTARLPPGLTSAPRSKRRTGGRCGGGSNFTLRSGAQRAILEKEAAAIGFQLFDTEQLAKELLRRASRPCLRTSQRSTGVPPVTSTPKWHGRPACDLNAKASITPRPRLRPNPKGIASQSPGLDCDTQAYPGTNHNNSPTPTGLRPHQAGCTSTNSGSHPSSPAAFRHHSHPRTSRSASTLSPRFTDKSRALNG